MSDLGQTLPSDTETSSSLWWRPLVPARAWSSSRMRSIRSNRSSTDICRFESLAIGGSGGSGASGTASSAATAGVAGNGATKAVLCGCEASGALSLSLSLSLSADLVLGPESAPGPSGGRPAGTPSATGAGGAGGAGGVAFSGSVAAVGAGGGCARTNRGPASMARTASNAVAVVKNPSRVLARRGERSLFVSSIIVILCCS